eukprot:PhF_6_TR26427/c0_g1_i2/m.38245
MKNGNIVLTSVLLLLFLHKSCECEKTFPTYSVTPSQNTFPLCPNYNGSFMASSPMLWTGLFAGLTVQLRNESCSMDCFDVLLNTTYCGIRVKVSEDSGVTLTSGNYSTWVAFANASEVSFLGNCSFEKMLQHIRNNFVARYNCSLSSANLPKVCSLRSRCVVNTKGYAFIWDRPYEFMISSSQPVSPGRYGPYTMVGEGAVEDFYETEFYKRRYYYREEMANLGAKRNATHWYWANTFLNSVEGKAFWDITANVSVNNAYTNWAPGEPRYDSNDSQKVVIDPTFGHWYVYPEQDSRYTYYKVTMMPEVTDALVLDQNITVILDQNVTVNITESSSPLPTPNTPPSRNNSGGGRNNSRSGGGSLPSKELATSITVIASVANYASLSPSTSLMAQRSMLVYRLMLCRLQDLKGLDDFSHPSSVEIEQDQYKGALVVNFGFVTFLFLFHVAYYKTRGEITPESKAAASRFPSHSIRAAVFFVQSICVTTFYILAQPQYPTVWKFVAAVLFLVYFGFLIWAFLRAMNKFHAIFVVSSNDVPPEFFVSKVIWHLTWSKGEWKDQPEYPGFHFQCGVLYNGFVPSRKWYLAVEVSGVIVLYNGFVPSRKW